MSVASTWTQNFWGAHKCSFAVSRHPDLSHWETEVWKGSEVWWLAGWVSSNGGRLWPGLTPVWACSDPWLLRSWLSTCSVAWVPERSALGPRTSQSVWRRAAACCRWLEKRWDREQDTHKIQHLSSSRSESKDKTHDFHTSKLQLGSVLSQENHSTPVFYENKLLLNGYICIYESWLKDMTLCIIQTFFHWLC